MAGDRHLVPLLVALGDEIHQKRLTAEVTQQDLAEMVGVNRTYLSDVERGRRNVTLATLSSIAAALNCTPGELLREAEMRLKVKSASRRRRG